MQQIITRLELIKTSILLEDEDVIALQVNKITSLKYDDYVAEILTKLEQLCFSEAINDIDAYISKKTGLLPYEDKEVQALKLELKLLERRLQDIVDKKNDCDIDIDAFNREYNLELGEVIQKILNLREALLRQHIIAKESEFHTKKGAYDKAKAGVDEAKRKVNELEEELERLDEFSDAYDELYNQYDDLKKKLSQEEQDFIEKRKEAKQAKEALDKDPINAEYEEAKEDVKAFKDKYDEVITEDVYVLDKEMQQELKAAYRKACRLCHPDTVSDELQEKAHEIMSELNIAKKRNDVVRVKEILYSLQTGGGLDLSSDSIYDKDLLKTKITSTKKKIDALEVEVNELEQSDTYKTILEINDKDKYFEDLKASLKEEAERLELELEQLNKPSSTPSPDINDHQEYEKPKAEEGYWNNEF